MIGTIISSIGVYLSTSIDYLVLLTILFTQVKNNENWQVYLGQYLGTGVLVLVSLFAAYAVSFMPEDWMVGLLGLIPIFLGLKFFFFGEEEAEEDEVREKVESSTSHLFITITALTIASGGDNLGVYIPYFASLSLEEILVSLIVFALGIIFICKLSQKISEIPAVAETIEK